LRGASEAHADEKRGEQREAGDETQDARNHSGTLFQNFKEREKYNRDVKRVQRNCQLDYSFEVTS
jgi:hypothetical protein